MARDLEQLVVSLDAEPTRLTKQLAKAGINLGDFAKYADKKAGDAAKSINKHLGEGHGGGSSGGLNFQQFQSLERAARASFEAISASAIGAAFVDRLTAHDMAVIREDVSAIRKIAEDWDEREEKGQVIRVAEAEARDEDR